MRFFFDRCTPIGVAEMVRAIDGDTHFIAHHDHDQRFGDTTPDVEWLKALSEDGDPPWVVISGDGRILKKRVERSVLDETNLPFFCLDRPWPNTAIYEYAWKFMKAWPKIVKAAQSGKGRIYRVSAGAALRVEIEA